MLKLAQSLRLHFEQHSPHIVLLSSTSASSMSTSSLLQSASASKLKSHSTSSSMILSCDACMSIPTVKNRSSAASVASAATITPASATAAQHCQCLGVLLSVSLRAAGMFQQILLDLATWSASRGVLLMSQQDLADGWSGLSRSELSPLPPLSPTMTGQSSSSTSQIPNMTLSADIVSLLRPQLQSACEWMRRGLRTALDQAAHVRADMLSLCHVVVTSSTLTTGGSQPGGVDGATIFTVGQQAMNKLASIELPHVDRFLFEYALDVVLEPDTIIVLACLLLIHSF